MHYFIVCFRNMYQFMILLLTCGRIMAEEKLNITVSSGAFFNEVPEVIEYEKSIPLIYT